MSNSRFIRPDEEQPILRDIPLPSRVEGKNALANVFGEVSQKAFEVGGNLADEASSSMYLASQANIEELKNNALMSMQKNPEKAEEFATLAKSGINSVTDTAYVNKADRGKLKYIAQSTTDDLAFKASEVQLQNANLQAKALLFANLPTNLKTISSSAIKDPKLFQDSSESFVSQWNGALKSGIVTGIEYANAMKSLGVIIDRAQGIHELYKNPEGTTANEFHKAIGSPLNTDTATHSNFPINENTNFLQAHISGEMDEQQVLADCSQGKLPDPETLMGLSDNAFKTSLFCMQGAQEAKANIDSHESFPDIFSRIDDLTQSGRVLSNQEKGELGFYKHYFGMLNNGKFSELMAETPLGGKIAQQYSQKSNALIELMSQTKDPNELAKLQSQSKNNYNSYVNDKIALGEAKKIPTKWIQPIDSNIIKPAQISFQNGQDPMQALKVLDMHNKMNQNYVASAMKTVQQQEVMHAVSLMRNVSNPITDSEAAKWITYNQEGKDFNLLKLATKDEGTTEKQIISKVTVGLVNSNILNFIGRLPSSNIESGYSQFGTDRNSAIVSMIVNRVKGDALEHNDFTVSNSDQYIEKAITELKKGYNIISGSNYQFNANDIPFDIQDAPFVSDYALDKAYKNFHVGKTEAEFRLSLDRNPFTVTMSRDHRLLVQDTIGNIVFDQLFTPVILSIIRNNKKKENESIPEKEMPKVEF